MKPSIYRRIRRRTASHEAVNSKKENKQESSFFGEAASEYFFQPAAVITQPPVINRKCAECEQEDKKMQRAEDKKEEDKTLQRMTDKKEEEKLQRQPEKKEEEKLMKKGDEKEEEKIQKKEAGNSTSAPVTSSYISSLNSKGTPLPKQSQQFFGSRMGYDFSNVKVHTDQEAARSAKEVNAKAYTTGEHIVFNEGQYDTKSAEGKKLMAHELAHVVQENSTKKLYLRGAVAPVTTPAPAVYNGPGGPINVQGANPSVPYAHNQFDNSVDAMFQRANRYDAIQYKRAQLEKPWITTSRGGNSPDFTSASKNVPDYQDSTLGRISYTKYHFHILDKIGFDFSQANDEYQLIQVFNKYKNWLIIPTSPKVCRVDDPPFDMSIYGQYGMYFIPENLNVHEIRKTITNEFQKRLKIIKQVQYKMAVSKALAEAEEITLQGKERVEGACSVKLVSRRGGNSTHDEFAAHVALIKGSFMTAGAETQFTTPEGISYTFDVFNGQTNTAYEVKTNHSWASDMLIAGTMYWDQFIKRAIDLDIQRLKGLYVANRCGLNYRYVFDNCATMLGMRKQWSNIPPVEYIPYPGKPKENCS